MPHRRNAIRLAGAVALVAGSMLTAGAASAQSPLGVWIDHTGRGAIEITNCNGALCGHVVWVKDAKHGDTCRNQILGNVKPVGSNTWDRGWIVDPDDNSRYSVELKPIGADRLRVVGYMGSKVFSETMTWRRAPADLQRCDSKGTQEARAVPAPVPVPVPAPPPANVTAPGQTQPLPPTVLNPSVPAAADEPQVSVAPIDRPAETPAPAARPSRELKPAPRRKVASATMAESEPPPPRQRRTASRNCRLDVPFVTIVYPCDAF